MTGLAPASRGHFDAISGAFLAKFQMLNPARRQARSRAQYAGDK
jgi:hypothetical protein